MKLLERILIAIDFSEPTDNIVENSIAMAKAFQSTICLMNVLPDDIYDDKAKKLLVEASTNLLDEINNKIKNEGVKCETPILEFGTHFDKIISTANLVNANLIMIGAGAKSKKEAYKIGTTASKILRKSNKAVMVIKNNEPLKIKKIFCPIDFSKESGRALTNAITMARRFDAELLIFSSFDMPHLGSLRLRIDLNEFYENARHDHLTEFTNFIRDFNLTDLKWNKEIKRGVASEEILTSINKYDADLLIMGTTGKTGLNKMLMGSVTEKVVREVPCSFITMKSEYFIDLVLETKIIDIASHYKTAKQLKADGFYDEAITEFKKCLTINEMHVPSLHGISKVYTKKGEDKKATKYKDMAIGIMSRIWDTKIEREIRKLYTV